jgi:hypothetical protein
MGATLLHVTVQPVASATGFQVQLDADQPGVTSVNMGNWDNSLDTIPIPVPYYTSDVWYARSLSQFVNSWWDWHTTRATTMVGALVQYQPRSNGILNTMHEVMHIAVSPSVDTVFPSPGNPASPYIAQLSGRVVLDIWDAGFSGITQNLAQLRDYGIGDCVVILHDWQHFGYDNGLPQHLSANSELGGGSALKAAIAEANGNGCYAGVHENYIDYYPDYPLFNSLAIALTSAGKWMRSWLNPTTGIQSFSTKPSWMVTNAATQSPEIHKRYGTTADYQDVLSAAPISSHGDMDAASSGASMLTTWTSAIKSLWSFERATHNGPVFGEGLNHWWFSGLLDGVEAQLGAGDVASNSDSNLSLFVDFDLFQLHPLQVNHGMGYYERWTSAGTPLQTTSQMDAYRMQEIAFGHAPFLSDGTWSDIWHAFLESNLVTPVASEYGTALASTIRYGVGGHWVTSSSAAISGVFNQVVANYSNGLSVIANASKSTLNWNGISIPQYGWAARGTDLIAYTGLCGATICDYAETSTSVFANARNQQDAQIGSNYAAPSITNLKQGNGKSFTITYAWKAFRSLGASTDYTAFVHFVDDSKVTATDPGIIFQDDHAPAVPASEWSPDQVITDGPYNVKIPSAIPDGTYSIRVGLYDRSSGIRLPLYGNNDGTERYIVGYIAISNGGSRIAFIPPPLPSADPRLNAAGTLVTFPAVKTDGMISIKEQGGRWVLRPFPRFRNFTVLLNTSKFPEPASIDATGAATSSTLYPSSQGSFWALELNGSSSYSWPVN